MPDFVTKRHTGQNLIPTTGCRREGVQIWIQIGIPVVVADKMVADEAVVVSA